MTTTIEGRIVELVRQELIGQDLRIRRIVRQELERWELVDDDPDVDEPERPAPTPPTPPPATRWPEPKAATGLVVDVRANDPASFGPRRTNRSQIVTAGAVFNFATGENDPTVDRLGGPLRYQADTLQAHGFVMEDGTTVRFGRVQRDRRLWIRSAGQFVNDGSYNPDHPDRLRVGPGGSDKLFHDGGPRTQQSFIDAGLRVGPDADELTFATEFIVEPWMFGHGHTTGPFELHSPIGCPITAPMTSALKGGHVHFWAKSQPTGPMRFPGTQPSNRYNVQLTDKPIRLPKPGSVVMLIARFRCDPTNPSESYFEAWISVDGSKPTRAGGHKGDYGYSFVEADRNAQFYPIVGQVYAPHKWWPGNWNWDSSTADGNVRRLDWAWALVDKTGQITAGDVMDHARTVANAA